MVDSHAIQLSGAQATLLMPLWARAEEAKHARPIMRDEKSVAIVNSVDYDFRRFQRKSVPIADYCIRSKIIDELVSAQLKTRPDSTVVEVGVGLDTRFDRLDNGRVRWIEFDLPDVIELRRRFFDTTDRREMLSGSLLDEAWIESLLQATRKADLVIAEGVFYFLSNDRVRGVLKDLATAFPGASVVFDAQSPVFLWFSNWKQPIARAELKFSVHRPGALEKWDPRFRVERCVGFGDAPFYDGLMHRLSWYKRALGWAHPVTRRLFQIIQLKLAANG